MTSDTRCWNRSQCLMSHVSKASLFYVQKVEMRVQEPQMTLLCVEDWTHTTKVGVQGQEPQMIWHCVEKGIHTTNSQG